MKLHNFDQELLPLVHSGKLSFSCTHEKLATQEVIDIWSILKKHREQGVEKYKDYLEDGYIETVESLYSNRVSFPNLDELNDFFSHTLWEFAWNNGLNEEEFYLVCSKGVFPITTYCRSKKEIDRSVYPDFIHDYWGHVPMLYNEDFSKFIKYASGEFIKLKYSDEADRINKVISYNAKEYRDNLLNECDETTIAPVVFSENILGKKKLISRLLLHFFEFGSISSNSKVKIYGGGILSSNKELSNFSEKNNRKRLTIESIKEYEYTLHNKQDRYLYVKSIDEPMDLLNKIIGNKDL